MPKRKGMRTVRFWVVQAILLSVSVSCLPTRQQADNSSTATESWFNGVKSVQNLGGSPSTIKVSWDLPLQSTQGFNVYSLEQVDGKTQWELIGEASSSATSYLHSGVISGRLYSYMVRAIDTLGAEDTNTKQLSTVAFDGIALVTVTGKTTVTVGLYTSLGSFDQVRIYAQPKNGGAKKMVASVQGNVSTINVTGLRSGVTYLFSAQAYMSFLGGEDGNQVTLEKQMPSESYGSGATTDTDYAYRGFMTVQAYGRAPGAPTDILYPGRQPKDLLVRLTWLPFSTATNSTKYRIFRVLSGKTMNTLSTTACTSSTIESCIVCTVTGVGTKTCEDTLLPAFNPATERKHFRYTIGLVKTDSSTGEEWVEELPSTNYDDFITDVHLPPDNMVLVHRDSVNYEMCQILNRTSNPRKKQRCPYTGIAATPYNSGPGKPALTFDSGYYDFGYNLFADRWPLACNWTTAASGGMCGPGGTSGDCIGYAATGSTLTNENPASDIADFASRGKIGDVYYRMIGYTTSPNTNNCWVKTSSGWQSMRGSTSLTAQERSAALTIDPSAQGGHRPIMTGIIQAAHAYANCAGFSNAYGTKRLYRRREAVAGLGFPWLSGEPYSWGKNPYTITRVRIGYDGQGAGYYQCVYATNPSYVTVTMPTNPADPLTALLDANNWRANFSVGGQVWGARNDYFIGSPHTINCVTRFGTQDISKQSIYIILSDQAVRQNVFGSALPSYLFITSSLDSGNKDLDGILFDGSTRGWTSSSASNDIYNNIATAATYFNAVIGMPFVAKSATAEDIMTAVDFRASSPESPSTLIVGGGSVGQAGTTGTVMNMTFYERRYDGRLTSNEYSMSMGSCVQEAE